MQDARDLLKTSLAAITAREQKFKRFQNMDQLVQFWLKELELIDDRRGEEDLAVILGVYHSTLFRWRKDEYKPQLNDLERYDSNVRSAVEHRKMIREMLGAEALPKARKSTRRVTREKAAGSRKPALSS